MRYNTVQMKLVQVEEYRKDAERRTHGDSGRNIKSVLSVRRVKM
jgi:hypothetical protein